MEYELYIDIYFIINFMLNFISLNLTAKVLNIHTSIRRRIITSSIVAIWNILLIFLRVESTILIFLFQNILPIVFLMSFGLLIKEKILLIKSIILAYIIAVAVAGILQLFERYIMIGVVFFILLIITYHIILAGFAYLELLFGEKKRYLKVELYYGEIHLSLNGLNDTGNLLKDPLTGKAVSVLDLNSGKKFTTEINLSKLRRIPYHTISGVGELAVLEIDRLSIGEGSMKRWIDSPIIAFTKEKISSNNSFQIILNGEIV